MPDPTTPPTDPTTVVLPDAAAQQAAVAGNEAVAHSAGMSREALVSYAKAAGLSATQTSLLTTALVGAAEGAERFGAGIDSNRVRNFGQAFTEFGKALTQPNTLVGGLTGGVNTLLDALGRMGGTSDGITKALGGLGRYTQEGAKALIGYAKELAKSADYQVNTQNAMIQQAAAMGNLGDLYNKTGSDLSRFNDMTVKQTTSLHMAAKALGVGDDAMRDWQNQLNAIPGVQKSLIESTGKANEEGEKFFTRVALFAKGSGRDYQGIMEDMDLATRKFGLGQVDALKYTARMTESADALGIPVKELRAALNSSVSAFAMYSTGGKNAADITDGMQESMSEYIKSLRDVGVPMENAIGLAKTMAGAVGEMGLAQKAFLSGQTGGPGGLMGAFQIEKMIKDGNIKGVMDKVKSAMTKELGHIVTVDEASKSEAAAQQMTRQIQMLKQGPLGKFAQTDADAERILESMKSGKVTKDILGTKGGAVEGNLNLEAAIKQGTKITQTTGTDVGKILNLLQDAKLSASSGAMVAAGNLASRSTARPGAGEKVNPALRQDLRTSERETLTPSHAEAFEQVTKKLKDMPQALGIAVKAFRDSLKSGDQAKIQQSSDALNKTIADTRATKGLSKGKQDTTDTVAGAAWQAMQKPDETQGQDKIVSLEEASKSEAAAAKRTMQIARMKSMGLASTDKEAEGLLGSMQTGQQAVSTQMPKPGASTPQGIGHTSGGQVRQAASQAVKTTTTATGAPVGPGGAAVGVGGGQQPGQQPIPVTLVGSGLTVNFTGQCPHCGYHISSTQQSQVTSPQSSNGTNGPRP